MVVCLTVIANLGHAGSIDFRPEQCQKDQLGDLQIKMEDMGWEQSLGVMANKFEAIYNSGKRLELRAYQAETGFVLPTDKGQLVHLEDHFLKSVVTHIETAIEQDYVDHIFFSDMGHSHLFVDLEFYNSQVSGLPTTERAKTYELVFNHKKTKFLYHTAEQLHMKNDDVLVDDRHTQWRFFTRNIVGDNLQSPYLEILHAKKHKMNTARLEDYGSQSENYYYWGAGFSISASKDGCFAYKDGNETKYFDMSLYDVKYGVVDHGGF